MYEDEMILDPTDDEMEEGGSEEWEDDSEDEDSEDGDWSEDEDENEDM